MTYSVFTHGLEYGGVYLFNKSRVVHPHNMPGYRGQPVRFRVSRIMEFMDRHNQPDMREVFYSAKNALGEKKAQRGLHREVEHTRHTTYGEDAYENGSFHHACLSMGLDEDYLDHEIVYLRMDEQMPLIVHRVMVQQYHFDSQGRYSKKEPRELFYLEGR